MKTGPICDSDGECCKLTLLGSLHPDIIWKEKQQAAAAAHRGAVQEVVGGLERALGGAVRLLVLLVAHAAEVLRVVVLAGCALLVDVVLWHRQDAHLRRRRGGRQPGRRRLTSTILTYL